MSLPVHDGSHTTCVATSSDHAQVSSLEFDGIHDFASVDVQLVRQNNLEVILKNTIVKNCLEKGPIFAGKICLKEGQKLLWI